MNESDDSAYRNGVRKVRKYPKYRYAGDMLCDLEIQMDNGVHRFHLLMKNGEEQTVNIFHLGEDDIIIADDDMEPCGWIDDDTVRSFLPAEE